MTLIFGLNSCQPYCVSKVKTKLRIANSYWTRNNKWYELEIDSVTYCSCPSFVSDSSMTESSLIVLYIYYASVAF